MRRDLCDYIEYLSDEEWYLRKKVFDFIDTVVSVP